MPPFVDLTGKRFGRLVALEATAERRHGNVVWLCRCDCGTEKSIRGNELRQGNTMSCGCLFLEMRHDNHTHNMADTPIYRVWQLMLNRCYNPNADHYDRYGGRGVKACERWHKFVDFHADVGDPPEGMTLDRYPDRNGDYEPKNFRWANQSQQIVNTDRVQYAKGVYRKRKGVPAVSQQDDPGWSDRMRAVVGSSAGPGAGRSQVGTGRGEPPPTDASCLPRRAARPTKGIPKP